MENIDNVNDIVDILRPAVPSPTLSWAQHYDIISQQNISCSQNKNKNQRVHFKVD